MRQWPGNLADLAFEVRNRLTARQYDLTTWGARSWLAFQTQQLSVKLHIACAWEIATELGIAAACVHLRAVGEVKCRRKTSH